MKRTLHNIMAWCLLAAPLVASCSDEEAAPLETLEAPKAITVNEVTDKAVTFEWDAVAGARQYGYRLRQVDGLDIDGGVTTATSITVKELDPSCSYTIMVKAFPHPVGSARESDFATKAVMTYVPENCETVYTTSLQANLPSVTKRGTISEDRTADDYEEGWYGVFTITKFYGIAGHDLVFRVNHDNTITVLNGKGHDEEGRVIVTTGLGTSATFSFDKIYIDESTSVFDGPNRRLTFSAKNNGTGSKLRQGAAETITWPEPENN